MRQVTIIHVNSSHNSIRTKVEAYLNYHGFIHTRYKQEFDIIEVYANVLDFKEVVYILPESIATLNEGVCFDEQDFLRYCGIDINDQDPTVSIYKGDM